MNTPNIDTRIDQERREQIQRDIETTTDEADAMIQDHELRISKFSYRGYPTNQWALEIRRTWDDGHGYSGEAWRCAAPQTFDSRADAEKYVRANFPSHVWSQVGAEVVR